MNSSSESLPPPPEYLLGTQSGIPQAQQINVAETIKALTEIRHMPASPGVLRRAQNQIQQQQQQHQPQNPVPSQYSNSLSTSPNMYSTQPLNDNHNLVSLKLHLL